MRKKAEDQIIEAKKNERANALEVGNRLFKEFGSTVIV